MDELHQHPLFSGLALGFRILQQEDAFSTINPPPRLSGLGVGTGNAPHAPPSQWLGRKEFDLDELRAPDR